MLRKVWASDQRPRQPAESVLQRSERRDQIVLLVDGADAAAGGAQIGAGHGAEIASIDFDRAG